MNRRKKNYMRKNKRRKREEEKIGDVKEGNDVMKEGEEEEEKDK